jgi:hypothetical protein
MASASHQRWIFIQASQFSAEHMCVRLTIWLDSSSKKPSADRNDKESYRQRRQFLPV